MLMLIVGLTCFVLAIALIVVAVWPASHVALAETDPGTKGQKWLWPEAS